MTLSRRAYLVALRCALVLSVFYTTAAQEKQAGAESRRLVVEVVDETFNDIRSTVAEDKNGGYMEFSPPRRVAGWKQPKGALPLTAIRLRSWREGESVRIEVAAVFNDSLRADEPGPKYGEHERCVASYLAREGETVRVDGLKQFGVEPFELKVASAEPETEMQPIPAPLRVINRLKSVEVVSFAKEGAHLENGRLTLLNVSSKNIVALEISVPDEGYAQTARAASGRALMRPGNSYETELHLGQTSATPQGLVQETPDALVVGTVLFDDGSYEGDVEAAARMTARDRGRLTQLARVLKLLQSALEPQALDAPDAVEKFKSQVAGLRIDAEPSSVDELLAKFPGLPKSEGRRLVASNILDGLSAGREETLNLLRGIENKPSQKATDSNPRRILEELRGYIEKRAGSSSR